MRPDDLAIRTASSARWIRSLASVSPCIVPATPRLAVSDTVWLADMDLQVRDRFPYSFGPGDRLGIGGFGQQGGEPPGAETGQILAFVAHALELGGDGAQHLVTNAVTVRTVDIIEEIEVDQHAGDRDRLRSPVRLPLEPESRFAQQAVV